MSISEISQLLLTQFGWNFKDRVLGTSRTDSNCQGDICPSNICPGDICPYMEYFSCYWPNFDEIFKVASWEHLEQITIKLTFVQAIFVLVTFVHIRKISQLLLIQFWPNVSGSFLVPSLTYANCLDNICSDNLCPGDVCLYQQCLRSRWKDFQQTFGTQFLIHS